MGARGQRLLKLPPLHPYSTFYCLFERLGWTGKEEKGSEGWPADFVLLFCPAPCNRVFPLPHPSPTPTLQCHTLCAHHSRNIPQAQPFCGVALIIHSTNDTRHAIGQQVNSRDKHYRLEELHQNKKKKNTSTGHLAHPSPHSISCPSPTLSHAWNSVNAMPYPHANTWNSNCRSNSIMLPS